MTRKLVSQSAALATRYCKECGLGPREWMDCEMPYCNVETQEEANRRARPETLNDDPRAAIDADLGEAK